ncbi:MAG: hypothetical protein NTY11_00635 [Candidatus Parcubacteria bacterium]|nr:hypothetical protein [Candidatus Parcubacteria bacterium]
MANNKILYIVIGVLVLIVVAGGIFLLSNKGGENKGAEEGAQTPATENKMVDCGEAKDPMCFINRMNGCLPVTVKMVGSDNTTKIELTVLGVEDEKCHFQRKINDVMDLDCFFPKGTMNWDTIDQTFGNDKGLQQVVDDACKKGW